MDLIRNNHLFIAACLLEWLTFCIYASSPDRDHYLDTFCFERKKILAVKRKNIWKLSVIIVVPWTVLYAFIIYVAGLGEICPFALPFFFSFVLFISYELEYQSSAGNARNILLFMGTAIVFPWLVFLPPFFRGFYWDRFAAVAGLLLCAMDVYLDRKLAVFWRRGDYE